METDESLSNRDVHISNLQAEIEVSKQAQAESNAAIALKEARLAELELSNGGLQDALTLEKTRLAELEYAMREHLSSLGLGIEKEGCDMNFGQALRDAGEAHRSAGVEAAKAQVAIQELNAQLDAERSASALQLEKHLGMEREIQALKDSCAASDRQSATQLATISQLERMVEEMKTLLQSYVDELQKASHSTADLLGKLQVTEADKALFSEELETTKCSHAETETALAEARGSISALGAQLAGSDELLGEVRVANAELRKQLARSQEEVDNWRSQVDSHKTSIESLRVELDSSTSMVKGVEAELAETAERARVLAGEVQAKAKIVEELTAEKVDALSNMTSLTARLQEANTAVATLEDEKNALSIDLARARAELQTKNSQRKELEEKLSVAETLHARLLADRQSDILQLRSQLDEANAKARSDMEVAHARWKTATDDYDSAMAAMGNTLRTSQTEVDRLQSSVDSLVAAVNDAQSQLRESRVQYTQVQDSFETEKQRVRVMEEGLAKANKMVEEAEEEIALLKKSKEVDAATIGSLKSGFARLQKAQLSSLAELENEVLLSCFAYLAVWNTDYLLFPSGQVVSAQSSPVPRVRASRRHATDRA